MGFFDFLFGGMTSWSEEKLYCELHATSSAKAKNSVQLRWHDPKLLEQDRERGRQLDLKSQEIDAEIKRRGLSELTLGKRVLEKKLGRRI